MRQIKIHVTGIIWCLKMAQSMKQRTQCKQDFLKKIYENLKNTAGYSGEIKLFNYVRKNGRRDITKHDIRVFLKKQPGWSYHGLIPRNFVRKPIKVCRPGLSEAVFVSQRSVLWDLITLLSSPKYYPSCLQRS